MKIHSGAAESLRLSVREYAECYLMSRAGELAPKSLDNAEKAVAALLEYLAERADEPMSDFRAADADGFATWALGRVRRGTVCKYVAYLTPMFALAERDETLSFNPFDGLEVPAGGESGRAVEPFTPEEVRAMLDSPALEPEWKSMVLCCIHLGGLRLGDVATLRWKQFDLAAGEAKLLKGWSRREESIPLSPRLAEHLATLPQEGEYLHPTAAARYLKFGSAPLSVQFLRRLVKAGVLPASKAAPAGTPGRSRLPKTFQSLKAVAVEDVMRANARP